MPTPTWTLGAMKRDSIGDKNNALIIAGLTLANKLLSSPDVTHSNSDIDLSNIIKKIDLVLDK